MKLSFISHIRIDTPERATNVQCTMKYYGQHFPDDQFIIVEDSNEHCEALDRITFPKNTTYYHFQNGGLINKANCLNLGTKMADGDVYAFLDVDAIVFPHFIEQAMGLMREHKLSLIFPHNGNFFGLKPHIKEEFWNSGCDWNVLSKYQPPEEVQHHGYSNENLGIECFKKGSESVSCLVLVDKVGFQTINGYNPNFKGWGYEDVEFIARMQKAKLPLSRITHNAANIWHLPHGKSVKFENPHFEVNQSIMAQVASMTHREVLEYSQTWHIGDIT